MAELNFYQIILKVLVEDGLLSPSEGVDILNKLGKGNMV